MTRFGRYLQHRRNRAWVRAWNNTHPVPCPHTPDPVDLGRLTVRPRSSAGADGLRSAPAGPHTTRRDWS